MATWDIESSGLGWWIERHPINPYEKKEEEEDEYEEEDSKPSLEDILRQYERNTRNTREYLEDEEQEEEDEEIKDHIESFIEAFKVPRNKQKKVKEILRKKNSERTQEEKDFLKQFIIKAKNIQKPKIEIVRQDDEPNDDEEELSEEEIEEAISNEEQIESLKNKLYDYYEKTPDLSPKGWPDLADPRGYYDWGTLDFEEALKKMSR